MINSVNKLVEKYIISDTLAEIWINEYFKYLILLARDIDNSVPSTIIEWVWTTHFQFYQEYWSLCISLFSEILYPENYWPQYFPSEDWKLKYSQTLLSYKIITSNHLVI